ncbi:MAG: hypothetical protein KDC54_15155 [Lewinella sp.]|nr:hypothetical protein [Lewinella sp.]
MENANTLNPRWNAMEKITFRFVFIFFLLFIAIQNNGAFPFWEYIFKFPTELLHQFIPWVGSHVLHLPNEITVFTNGSGDTTYDYVIVFTIAVTAVLGTTIWSALDRNRVNYTKLYYWLTVAIRFYVGLMLIQYGLVKIIKLQFPSPGIYRLTQFYGDSSPMGLAWTFLGFSKGYNLFMGIAEVAAVLLLFRRTMTFGAIITLMTTANVVAVNYCYDVPVKILSTALFTMTLFLLLRDARRLFSFFFTGTAVALPVIPAPVLGKRWLKVARLGIKTLLIGYGLIYGFIEVLDARKQYGDHAPKPKLYGLYDVDIFIRNNDTIPPLLTDSIRWNQFIIEWEGYANARHMVDSMSRFFMKLDTLSQQLELTVRADTTMKYAFAYEMPTSDQLTLTGLMQKDTVSIFMTRKELDEFLLTNRGFHWVNEFPFNR